MPRAWALFHTRGRVAAMASAVLVVVLLGAASAFAATAGGSSCAEGTVEVACPTDPVGPHGGAVSDAFSFAHQPLGEDGSITVRLASMTGVVTYPPPDHDEIVPGLAPWAKAGVMIKAGTAPGSPYAALMATGEHGVRMQYDYTEDVAGRLGGAAGDAPRWLRLTRSGDDVTGHESADGRRWTEVGTAHLPGLPETVQVGMFATSPGDLTLRPVGLGAHLAQTRFTQATAVFEEVRVEGAADGEWRHTQVGDMGHTDWEKNHRAPGVTEADGAFTVTGSGDIGPVGTVGGPSVEDALVGLAPGLLVVLVVAARFAAAGPPPSGRGLAARAVVVGAGAFAAGLAAAGAATLLGEWILRSGGAGTAPVPMSAHLGLVAGTAGLFAASAVFGLAVGALVRRTWAAAVLAPAALLLPYLAAVLPLLPDGAADHLLRLTPAAGFAVTQTLREFPQVVAHYAPSAGYFPLPGWAGLAVLCGYAAALLGLAALRSHRAAAPAR